MKRLGGRHWNQFDLNRAKSAGNAESLPVAERFAKANEQNLVALCGRREMVSRASTGLSKLWERSKRAVYLATADTIPGCIPPLI